MAPPGAEDPVLGPDVLEDPDHLVFIAVIEVHGRSNAPCIELFGDVVFESNELFFRHHDGSPGAEGARRALEAASLIRSPRPLRSVLRPKKRKVLTNPKAPSL